MISTVLDGARRALLLAIPAAMIMALWPVTPAQAKWPEKPVRIVLPFGAGGVADVSSRILADKLSQILGQRVVIENMPGPRRHQCGGGRCDVAAGRLHDGPGYQRYRHQRRRVQKTAIRPGHAVGDGLDHRSVRPGAGGQRGPEFKTLGDFLKAAKATPGKLNIGTIAVGSTQNLGAELFGSMADVNVQIVPYKNSPDIVVALLRNAVQMLVNFRRPCRGS